MRTDPKLGAIIKRVGPCELHAVAPKDPFEALSLSIASQQLSTKAADTIFRALLRPVPARPQTVP